MVGTRPTIRILVLGEMEQDDVADDVAAVADRHELLGAVDGKIGEAVDRQMRQHLQGVRPLDHQLGHVVRLVEQHHGLAPCPLLVAPVGELVGHHRIDIGADLRIAQHVHRVRRFVEQLLEVLFSAMPGLPVLEKKVVCRRGHDVPTGVSLSCHFTVRISVPPGTLRQRLLVAQRQPQIAGGKPRMLLHDRLGARALAGLRSPRRRSDAGPARRAGSCAIPASAPAP